MAETWYKMPRFPKRDARRVKRTPGIRELGDTMLLAFRVPKEDRAQGQKCIKMTREEKNTEILARGAQTSPSEMMAMGAMAGVYRSNLCLEDPSSLEKALTKTHRAS